MLASLLLFIVLFSSGSEHSGYVIAALGMGIWWVNFPPPARGRLEWTLLLLALFASFSYNLLPTKFYRGVFVAYALRSLPFFAIWLHCIRRLWREDFAVTDVLLDYKTLPAADEAANEAAESRPARPGDGSTSYARVTIRLRGSSLRWPAPMRSFAPGIRTSACT